MYTIDTVITELIEQRGYTLCESDHPEVAFKAIKPCGEPFHVVRVGQPSFGVNALNAVMKDVVGKVGTHHIMIVHSGKITAKTQKVIGSTDRLRVEEGMRPVRIETFHESRLRYNITKHRLQPRFEKTEYTERDFTRRFGVYPTMYPDDPVARFYGYVVDDVIRVTRRDGSVFHRVVRETAMPDRLDES